MSCRAGVWTFRPRYLVGIVLILSTLVPTSIWLYGDSSYVEWIYPSPTDPASDFKDGITWKPSPPSSYSASSSPSHALSYPPDDELPQVHLFVPVNKEKVSEDARFCRVLQGAIVNGWKPIIFNWDVEVQQQKHKPYGLANILNSPNFTAGMQESDLIFMMDSLDVWLQLSPRVLARRFLEYDEDILVAAEKNCFPNSPESKECMDVPPSPVMPGLYVDNDYPHQLSPLELTPTHANSGTIVGRLSKMREFYNSLTAYMSSPEYYWYDDQGAFNILLSERKIKLDYYNRLFWPAHDDFHNFHFIGTHYPPDPSIEADAHHHDGEEIIPWDLFPPLGHHGITGQVPIAIHFNGGAKEHLEEWWGKLWWASERARFRPLVRRRMDRGTVRIVTDDGFREESVRELCPVLRIWEWDEEKALDQPLSDT